MFEFRAKKKKIKQGKIMIQLRTKKKPRVK